MTTVIQNDAFPYTLVVGDNKEERFKLLKLKPTRSYIGVSRERLKEPEIQRLMDLKACEMIVAKKDYDINLRILCDEKGIPLTILSPDSTWV